MEIKVAKTAGFCFGVNRAVELTYGLLAEGRRVATLGPLIHNPQAVADMQRRGALVADTVEDIPAGYEVVIRSHGVPCSVYDALAARGVRYHDATCPFVQKIQRIAEQAEKENAVLLVAGDKTHPEASYRISAFIRSSGFFWSVRRTGRALYFGAACVWPAMPSRWRDMPCPPCWPMYPPTRFWRVCAFRWRTG